VVVLPDIYCNAGGVSVSYMEWVQNIQQYRWDEKRVNQELHGIMKHAWTDLKATRDKYKCPNLRTAAFAMAIERVARTTVLRGVG
jgi:glutamate dehydrogenase (NAD(P)+)